tara:strand:- start:283 stop:402 length:120 start_codon:yes stop_codon:yes gene_type:complete
VAVKVQVVMPDLLNLVETEDQVVEQQEIEAVQEVEILHQ